MGSKPGLATIRVTAADAREAVERLEEEIEEEAGTDLDSLVTREAEVPILLDDDLEEEIEEIEEIETIEARSDTGPLGRVTEAPMMGSGLQRLPTMPSEPIETGPLTSGGYAMPAAPPQADGMRLGAIVAMAGLFALLLGGLTAFLVLGGDDDDERPTPAVSAAPEGAKPTETKKAEPSDEPDAAEPTPPAEAADVGTVEVRAVVEGARVEVDGKDEGEAPVSLELSLGEHRVRVTAAGYHPWQTTIDVTPGTNGAVKAELVAAEATPEPTPAPEPKPKAGKRPKPKPKADSGDAEPKPKPKPKSDVFMDPSKKKDDGIFMPVGGK